MPLRETLKTLVPPSAWRLLREVYLSARLLPYLPGAYLHPWRWISLYRLTALKDIHRGQRAFIIGNGPSLRHTDLSLLRNEYTFGLNRIYLLFPELGFTTTYLVSVNDLVIEQCREELAALPIPKFFSWRSRRHFRGLGLRQEALPTFLFTTYEKPTFARDARFRLWEGATVTYVALQLAFHMGFDEVILVGVDHHFVTRGQANQTVVSEGEDPNHFDPRYFGKGFRWQLPDLETSEIAYRMARRAYEQAGRRVLDATIGGKLTVFPKVEYGSLFHRRNDSAVD